jgi:hypothetical protein
MPKLTFAHINDTQFEEFTFDLLHELKFVNIDWRKGTPKASSPADKGRDIVAEQIVKDVADATTLEKWFVDCKHFKRAVPPTELQNLLAWAEAERPDVALFVVSGYLSNPAKDYIETYKRNNRPPFKIKYWELAQLERMAKKKMTLLRKHNVTEAPIRSVKQILAAEQEFFDRIWYDRSLVHDQKDKEAGRKMDPKLRKVVLAARAKVEAKYGGKKATRDYYKDDFEWGMMNGKLSTLRWVLGDDWDFLDT